jgi:biotin carboxyl carrier protein
VLEVVAEMVANVVTVEVTPGRRVAEGDTLLVVESMKMEIPVLAPAAATVFAVQVDVADVVQEGDVLVLLEQD